MKAIIIISGRPSLPVIISPAACRVRPSSIATKHVHFAFLPIFGEVRIAAGLTVDRAESKRATSDTPALTLSISPAACRAQPGTIAKTRISHFSPFLAKTHISHFSPFLHFVTHLAVSQALLACYCCLRAATCCGCLLLLLLLLAVRSPGPRSLGFGDNPGEGSEQSVPWPVWLLSGARSRLIYTCQKSHWSIATMGAIE